MPTGKVDVVIVTTPVVGLIVPDPRVVVPLVTVTVPVVPIGRVVVMVTGEPKVLGPEVVTVTVGVALLTVWVRLAVAVLLFASPLYVAVIESLPEGNAVVANVATPFVTVEVPRTVAPLVKVTVPVTFVGNVAVKVTD